MLSLSNHWNHIFAQQGTTASREKPQLLALPAPSCWYGLTGGLSPQPPRTPGRSQVLWRLRTLSWETPQGNFIPTCRVWDASEISSYWTSSHREGADGHLPGMLAKGLSPSFPLHLDFNFHLNLRSDPRAQGAGHQEAAFKRLRCLVWNVWSFEFVFIPIETNRKKKKKILRTKQKPRTSASSPGRLHPPPLSSLLLSALKSLEGEDQGAQDTPEISDTWFPSFLSPFVLVLLPPFQGLLKNHLQALNASLIPALGKQAHNPSHLKISDWWGFKGVNSGQEGLTKRCSSLITWFMQKKKSESGWGLWACFCL